MKCDNCGYVWEYGGKLMQTTCPNCGKKTKTKIEIRKNEAEAGSSAKK